MACQSIVASPREYSTLHLRSTALRIQLLPIYAHCHVPPCMHTCICSQQTARKKITKTLCDESKTTVHNDDTKQASVNNKTRKRRPQLIPSCITYVVARVCCMSQRFIKSCLSQHHQLHCPSFSQPLHPFLNLGINPCTTSFNHKTPIYIMTHH